MEEKATFSSVIKSRGFRFLWINQILMQLATNTLNFALIIWIYKLTESNFAVSALILAVYLPAFLFGIIAGVFVDLADRRKVIIIIDLLFALSFFIFPFIRSSYPLLLLNTFFLNSLAQFFTPAESSSIPLLVPKDKLFIANALFSFTLYGAFMIGFTLAGPLLNLYGINSIFYIGGVLLVGAFFISQRLPKLKVPVSKRLKDLNMQEILVSETKKTMKFIRGKLEVLASIGLLAGMQGVIGVLAVMVSGYMEKVLRIHATDASLFLMLPLGLGMVIGALTIGRFFHHLPKRYIVIPALIMAGILLFGVGIAPAIAKFFNSHEIPEFPHRIKYLRYFFNAPSLSTIFAIGAFFMGACAVAIIVPSQTVLQENTNNQNRGKIFAVLTVFMNAFAALPVILAGALADIIGVTSVFMILGGLIFLTGIMTALPHIFFPENKLPIRVKSFLGLGHWKGN
jgi:MFS family permease